MILIGVSGSSKCDWQLIEGNKIINDFSTGGLNPIFHTEERIVQQIGQIENLSQFVDKVEVIYIYSAGCGSKSLQNVVRRALSTVFPGRHYYVNHDIVASALAVYEGVPVIAGILGTGSNACYFDGDIVRQETPALDYVLGDEGSGSFYGRKLLNAYLYKTLPEELARQFQHDYTLTKDDVLENVYMKPYPNVYLASFMPFIEKHKHHPYFDGLISEGMRRYFELYITTLPKYESTQCHFTGSIAFYFEDILKRTAEHFSITVGKIIKEPVTHVATYHLNKSMSK